MAIADSNGLPISIHVTSASPHEVTLAEETITNCIVNDEKPERLIGDGSYDSDPLDVRLAIDHGIELIAPHRQSRKEDKTQDGRVPRRYKRRWKIERLFSWLQNFRRVLVRYDCHADNYLGFVQLGCILFCSGGVYEMSSSQYMYGQYPTVKN
jgi:transposase